jgi:hypothetical protein
VVVTKEGGMRKEYDYPAMWERIVGPIRERLGMNKEDEMGDRFNAKNAEQEKAVEESAREKRFRARARKALLKRTKVALVADLESVMRENLRLRQQLDALENPPEMTADAKDAAAIERLALRVAEHMATDGDVVDAIQEKEHLGQLLRLLRGMLEAQAILVLIDGDTERLSVCLSDRRSDTLWPMIVALDDAQERIAKQLVDQWGAQALVAQLVRLQREREE